MHVYRLLTGVFVALGLSAGNAPLYSQDKDNTVGGMLVTVPNPINEGIINRIKTSVDQARSRPQLAIKKVVFDFNPEGKDAATDSYGPCYELAKYIKQLEQNGLTTIAFVHGKVTRHSVLPVLACDDFVMSSGGTIGEVASKDRTVTRAEIDYYQELAGLSRAGAVLKMMDAGVKLVQGRYKDSWIFVDLRKVDAKDPAYADVAVTNRTPIPMGAGYELYDFERSRKFLGCKLPVENLDELADRYALPPGWRSANPINEQGIKACRILVEGPINVPMREKIRRQIQAAKDRKENYFFFVLDCGGGDLGAAVKIADDLIALAKDPDNKVRTIAFVPNKAPDLAIFLALACEEIVMYQGPLPEGEAVLGEFETYIGDPRRKVNVENLRKNLETIAEGRGFSKVLLEGLFVKETLILNVRNNQTNERRMMTEAEFLADQNKVWVKESVVKEKGTLLRLNASKAKNLRIATVVDNKDIGEVYAKYGVEAKAVRQAEPSWLDNFAAFLRRTEVAILLVIIGIAGLVLELKAPGLMIPGIIAAFCFILFFWSQTQLGGQLIYLAIMLFLLGLALLAIEIFLIPGFGFTGVAGILLILCGLVLATVDKAPEDTSDWIELFTKMLRYGLTMAGAVVLSFVLSRFLPKIPYANRLMLVPPEDRVDLDEEPSPLPGVDLAVSLLGHVGTTTSMLRPSGMAKFGERYVDVVTEGDFIPPDTAVQVVEVEGTRIVVKRV